MARVIPRIAIKQNKPDLFDWARSHKGKSRSAKKPTKKKFPMKGKKHNTRIKFIFGETSEFRQNNPKAKISRLVTNLDVYRRSTIENPTKISILIDENLKWLRVEFINHVTKKTKRELDNFVTNKRQMLKKRNFFSTKSREYYNMLIETLFTSSRRNFNYKYAEVRAPDFRKSLGEIAREYFILKGKVSKKNIERAIFDELPETNFELKILKEKVIASLNSEFGDFISRYIKSLEHNPLYGHYYEIFRATMPEDRAYALAILKSNLAHPDMSTQKALKFVKFLMQ